MFRDPLRELREAQQALSQLKQAIDQKKGRKEEIERKIIPETQQKLRELQKNKKFQEIPGLNSQINSTRNELSRINYDLPRLESQRQEIERQLPEFEKSIREIRKRS